MKPSVRYRHAPERGRYSPFDFAVRCTATDDYATFCHEYLHHVQNISSIHGAERLSAFMQVMAHVSRLAKNSNHLQVPLLDWAERPELPAPEVQSALTNIVGHWDIFLYLEQCFRYSNLERHLEDLELLKPDASGEHFLAIFQQDVFGDGDRKMIPCLVQKTGKILTGYPIGALTVAEGSARGIEMLVTGKKFPYVLNQEQYAYNVIPFVVERLLGIDQTGIASLLIGDLAFAMGPPGLSFLQLYGELIDTSAKSTSDQLMALHESLSRSFADQIEFAITQERSNLLELQSLAKEQHDAFRDVIDWQVSNLNRSFEIRLNDPSYFARHLVQGTREPKAVAQLVKEFPPLLIQIQGQPDQTNSKDFSRHTMLNRLFSLFEFLFYDADLLHQGQLESRAAELDLNILRDDSKSAVCLSPREIEDGLTNHEGIILRVLGLEEKELLPAR